MYFSLILLCQIFFWFAFSYICFCECWCLWSCFGFVFVSLVSLVLITLAEDLSLNTFSFFNDFLTLPFILGLFSTLSLVWGIIKCPIFCFLSFSVGYILMRFSFTQQVSLNVSSWTCWHTYVPRKHNAISHTMPDIAFYHFGGLTLDNEAPIDFELCSVFLYTHILDQHTSKPMHSD